MKKRCGIYKITNNQNGHYYIGSSCDIDQRWTDHKKLLRKQKHKNMYLQNAWNKYGESVFGIEQICSVIIPNNLQIVEQYFLDNEQHTYNICLEATNCYGVKRREETKRRISISKTGKKIGPLAPDHKLAISRANTGENNGGSKLKIEDVVKIKELLQKPVRLTAIAKMYGVCIQSISNIKYGKKWKNI